MVTTQVVMKLPKLSPAEYEIMAHVWELGSVTVGEVFQRVQLTESVARTTVQVQMERLEKKGWLRRSVADARVTYRAARTREQADLQLAADLKDRVFAGSLANLVKCFVSAGKVDPEELRRVREILENTPPPSKPR